MKKALLIIDVQNDYFPNGKCPLYKPEAALNTIKDLLKKFQEAESAGYLHSSWVFTGNIF